MRLFFVVFVVFSPICCAASGASESRRALGEGLRVADDLPTEECEDDDDDDLGSTFGMLAIAAFVYATIGDLPGSDFSFGRYPYAARAAWGDDIESDVLSSLAFNGDPEKRYGFARARLDTTGALDESLIGYSAFFKVESSYTPGLTLWHQQAFGTDGEDASLSIAALESRIVTHDNVRLFWNLGASVSSRLGEDDAGVVLGFGAEVWPREGLMVEPRFIMHFHDSVLLDASLGVSYQLYKSVFLTAGYRVLFDSEEVDHYASLGVTLAFGF